MNALAELLNRQRDQLRERGVTIDKITERAGLAQSVIYDHLRRTEPFMQTPRPATLRKLAAGFQLDIGIVLEAAREATGPVRGNPLQLLLRTRRVDLGRTTFEAAQVAENKGYSVSMATLSNILSGKHVNLEEDTVRAVAAAFDLPVEDVQQAARESSGKTDYLLPAHIESRMTPQKWSRLVKMIEIALALDESSDATGS